MNYWHAFHAGGYTEVFKHAVLVLLLEHLAMKETPFFVLDSHAGVGEYDLDSEEALRTGEAANGIKEVIDKKVELAETYLGLVKARNHDRVRYYPGSPAIIQSMLRPQDRLLACELTERAGIQLRRSLGGDGRRISIQIRDGYEAMNAFLPPPERRGLVFTDPPYEAQNEFEMLASTMKGAFRKWRTGIYAAWYPVKNYDAIKNFRKNIKDAGANCLFAEFVRYPKADAQLKGSGIVLLNPPWRMAEKIERLGGDLMRAFSAPEGYCLVEQFP